MTTANIHIGSVVVSFLAYAIAALTAYFSKEHRAFCLVYLTISFAIAIYLGALILWEGHNTPPCAAGNNLQNQPETPVKTAAQAIKKTRKNDTPVKDPPLHADRSPIPDAVRITYYDDCGVPYYTEWQMKPPLSPAATLQEKPVEPESRDAA